MAVHPQTALFISEVKKFAEKTVPEDYRDKVLDLAVDIIKEAQAGTPVAARRGGEHMNELWMITAKPPRARRKSRQLTAKPKPFQDFYIINDAYWSDFVERGTVKMPGRFVMRKAIDKATARMNDE